MKKLVPAVSAALLAAGCSTYAADRYAVSMDSHSELQTLAAASPDRKIAVQPFTASRPGRTDIACRGVGPVKTPDGETFEAYIRKALIDQLRLAQMYASDGSLRISGNLDKADFDSFNGMWYLVLTVRDETGRTFTVREDYDYQSSWYGETACNQTAQAFMPAVQNLVRKVIADPMFQQWVVAKA